MKHPPSEGVCQLCQGKFAKNTIVRHLQHCLAEHEPARGSERKIIHLAVDGYAPYWLHVDMPGEATFRELDGFLRDIWLECCGHLSAFQFDRGVMSRRGIAQGSDFDWNFEAAQQAEDELMDCELAEVLEP